MISDRITKICSNHITEKNSSTLNFYESAFLEERKKFRNELMFDYLAEAKKLQSSYREGNYKPRVAIIIGAPGAGKTTLRSQIPQKLFSNGFCGVEVDPSDLVPRIPEFHRIKIDNWSKRTDVVIEEVFLIADNILYELRERGVPVIMEYVRDYSDMEFQLKEFVESGYEVGLALVRAELEECVGRVRSRLVSQCNLNGFGTDVSREITEKLRMDSEKLFFSWGKRVTRELMVLV